MGEWRWRRDGLTQRYWPSDQRDLVLGYLLEREVLVAAGEVARQSYSLIVFVAELVETDELVPRLGGEAPLQVHEIDEASCVLYSMVYG